MKLNLLSFQVHGEGECCGPQRIRFPFHRSCRHYHHQHQHLPIIIKIQLQKSINSGLDRDIIRIIHVFSQLSWLINNYREYQAAPPLGSRPLWDVSSSFTQRCCTANSKYHFILSTFIHLTLFSLPAATYLISFFVETFSCQRLSISFDPRPMCVVQIVVKMALIVILHKLSSVKILKISPLL